jgi:hypothetical protein
MARGENFETLYQGGYSSLDPNKAYQTNFVGYRVPTGSLGGQTNPTVADQISEVNKVLNQGIKPIEVQSLKPDVFQTIPKQHFKEINRMSKLTGTENNISMHAPIIEPSGMGEQGWSETSREAAEKELNDVMEKAYDLNPKGNTNVTIHSSGTAGSEFKMGEKGLETEKLVVVEKESGKPVQAFEKETLFQPGMEDLEKGEEMTPEERLRSMNKTQWENQLNQLFFNKDRADEILQKNREKIQYLQEMYEQGKINEETLKKDPTAYQGMQAYESAGTYLKDLHQQVGSFFDKAWKHSGKEDKKKLRELNERFKKEISRDPVQQSQAIQNLINGLNEVTPEQYVPIEEFALENSSKTFANVAFNAYKNFGENAPVVSVENLYTGMGFSSAKDFDKLITSSKEQFTDKLVKEKKISEDKAKKIADKLIGATLDVGHLNIAKKKGFTDEDLRKEVEQIAKHVKEVHITDNFGYSDSHLAPGMGNVPFKEILKELEKQGKGKARKILEAGGFAQAFKKSPYPAALEAFGSPFYSEDTIPYWNQSIGLQQSYSSGLGEMLPQVNYQTFGAGFSQLPLELGGSRGGGGSRMSGRPME